MTTTDREKVLAEMRGEGVTEYVCRLFEKACIDADAMAALAKTQATSISELMDLLRTQQARIAELETELKVVVDYLEAQEELLTDGDLEPEDVGMYHHVLQRVKQRISGEGL